MKQSAKSSSRSNKRALVLAAAWILALSFCFFLFALAGCSGYNPALYPSYDVLNPGPDVLKNPISSTEDPITHESLFIVNTAFLQWVDELKQEVIKLRKGMK